METKKIGFVTNIEKDHTLKETKKNGRFCSKKRLRSICFRKF